MHFVNRIFSNLEQVAGKFQKGSGHPVFSHFAVIASLVSEGRLEAARKSADPAQKAEVAAVVVNACVTLCTAIGTEPIPLADFPVLTSLQVTMVASIMYISGRRMSRKIAAEFVAALGANIGTGIILREGARALLKFFPGWGNVISGAIAGAGTYAIGKAATLYFIDGDTLYESRQLCRRAKHEFPE